MSSEQKNGYRIRDRRGSGSGLVDQHGRKLKPTSGFGLYPTPRYAGADHYRPRPYIGQGTKRGLSPFDRWELMNYSRQLFSQLGNLGSAIVQKNQWATGDAWNPIFTGREQAWGNEVEKWLIESFYPVCDVRGEPYDFKTSLFLSGLSWDVDGDDAMIFTESMSGFPMLRFVPAHLIGGGPAENEVKGGPFDGAKIYDGVIFNRDNRAIGYRILDEDDGDGYKDIPAFNCQMMYEPEWKDQGRGIPRVGRSILDWFDYQDIDVFLKRGVKLDASLPLVHFTETGEALDGTETVSADELSIDGAASGDTRKDAVIPTRSLQVEPINGGEILYMRANSGEKLEGIKTERPHPNTEAFMQRIERRGLLAVGWFYDLLDLTSISGAPSRLLKDLAMMSVQCRQRNLRRRALRAVRYAVGKGMKTGKIAKYYPEDGDAFMWGFEMPGEISIDTGNDEQADRENLKLGTSNLATICAKKGLGDWRQFTEQTKREIEHWAKLALEIEKNTQGKIPFKEALAMLTQRTPNQQPDAPGEPNTPPGKPKPK